MRPAGQWQTGPPVVALGGGHGLAATLRALRRVTDSVTAVVGVSDDGGSSGRIRKELGLIPPGDLRMALAALCGDDTWGRTWSRVLQHRFEGGGELEGHAVGDSGEFPEGCQHSLSGIHKDLLKVIFCPCIRRGSRPRRF